MPEQNTTDLIHRFLFDDSDIRGEIVTLDRSYLDAKATQNIHPKLHAQFGEFLVGASMVSEVLKFDGLITLQARGNGDVSILMAEANHQGDLRGVVSVADDAQLLNDDNDELKSLPALLGEGVLALTLDPDKGQRYQGIVPLDGANLAECLSHYFEQSEQVPTHIVLFTSEGKCGGLFLQCLPSSSDEKLAIRNEQWETIKQLTATMQAEEFFENDHPTLLYRLYHELNCRVFEPKALRYKCSCSRKRSAGALKSLGNTELNELISEDKPLEIDCQFCGAHYQFTTKDLRQLLNDKTLH